MAFSIPLATLTAAVIGYAVYAERRQRQTRADVARAHQALAVLDDELTATNRAIADNAAHVPQIVEALKRLDARTLMHQTWLNGLSAVCRLSIYQPTSTQPSEPIDPNDVIAEAERIVKGGGA